MLNEAPEEIKFVNVSLPTKTKTVATAAGTTKRGPMLFILWMKNKQIMAQKVARGTILLVRTFYS